MTQPKNDGIDELHLVSCFGCWITECGIRGLSRRMCHAIQCLTNVYHFCTHASNRYVSLGFIKNCGNIGNMNGISEVEEIIIITVNLEDAISFSRRQ